MTEYKKLTDEELIRRLRMGETGIIDYLMEKYKNLVRKEANSAFHIVCRTACSLYLSVLRHNLMLNIQLNHIHFL